MKKNLVDVVLDAIPGIILLVLFLIVVATILLRIVNG